MKKIARVVYWVAAWLFLGGVAIQVFLAGMVVVARKISWVNHISLGHMLALPILILLVTQYLGRMPVQVKRLTWALFGVYVLQADVLIFLRVQVPVLSALHPVLALADFVMGLALARAAWSVVRQDQAQTSLLSERKLTAHAD